MCDEMLIFSLLTSHLDKDVMKFSKIIRGMEKSSRNLPILIM